MKSKQCVLRYTHVSHYFSKQGALFVGTIGGVG